RNRERCRPACKDAVWWIRARIGIGRFPQMRYGTGVSTGESGTSRRRAILRVPGAVITHPERGRLLAAPRFSLRAAAIAAVATAGLLAAAVRIRAHVTDSPWSPAAIAAAGSVAIAVFLTLK